MSSKRQQKKSKCKHAQNPRTLDVGACSALRNIQPSCDSATSVEEACRNQRCTRQPARHALRPNIKPQLGGPMHASCRGVSPSLSHLLTCAPCSFSPDTRTIARWPLITHRAEAVSPSSSLLVNPLARHALLPDIKPQLRWPSLHAKCRGVLAFVVAHVDMRAMLFDQILEP